MSFTDYPYLRPGQNTIGISGGLTTAQLRVSYAPAYI